MSAAVKTFELPADCWNIVKDYMGFAVSACKTQAIERRYKKKMERKVKREQIRQEKISRAVEYFTDGVWLPPLGLQLWDKVENFFGSGAVLKINRKSIIVVIKRRKFTINKRNYHDFHFDREDLVTFHFHPIMIHNLKLPEYDMDRYSS